MSKPTNQIEPSICIKNQQSRIEVHSTDLGGVVSEVESQRIDRDELENRAKGCCPETLWYDLLDSLGETQDDELLALIEQYER